jgi:hypothetical protein
MPDIFSSRPGLVAVLPAGNTLPTFVSLGGWGSGARMKGVLVGLNLAAADGHQITHSLRTFQWVYSFGPRVVELMMQGVYFAGVCGGDGSSGLERAYQYFEQTKLSATGAPVKASLGTYTSLQGFLVGAQMTQSDPQSGMGAFQFHLRCPPQPKFNLPALPANS